MVGSVLSSTLQGCLTQVLAFSSIGYALISVMIPVVIVFAQLYQEEHRLLRELAEVDSALDDNERRAKV